MSVEWGAAAPAPHQLRREQLALVVGLSVCLQEAVERPNPRLVLAQPDECPVSAQHVGLWRRKRHPGLPGISQDELAGFDRRSLTGQRLDATALDRGLTDRIPVPERVQIARLSAEVLRGHDCQARPSFVVLPRGVHRAAPRLLRIAEDADADVDDAAPELRLPVVRVVDAAIEELRRTRGHPNPERFREALQ